MRKLFLLIIPILVVLILVFIFYLPPDSEEMYNEHLVVEQRLEDGTLWLRDLNQYVGEKVYFWEDKILQYREPNGEIKEFPQVKVKKTPVIWLLSADEKKVAWLGASAQGLILSVVDLDGNNKKVSIYILGKVRYLFLLAFFHLIIKNLFVQLSVRKNIICW